MFAVRFNVSALTTEEINNSALELINTLIENGDKYTDNFPIKINSLSLIHIYGIIIPAERGLFHFFASKEDDFIIKWDKIRTIGDDVILVEVDGF